MFTIIVLTTLFLISVTLLMLGARTAHTIYTTGCTSRKLERKRFWLIASGCIVMIITFIIKYIFLT